MKKGLLLVSSLGFKALDHLFLLNVAVNALGVWRSIVFWVRGEAMRQCERLGNCCAQGEGCGTRSIAELDAPRPASTRLKPEGRAVCS